MAPNQQIITATNKSPLIEVFAWFFMSISVLSIMARIGTKLVMTGSIKLDDHMALAALVTAIAQGIAVLVQCTQGLGQPMKTLDDSQITSILKGGYAADGLYIASLAFAKVSLVLTVATLAPRSHKRLIWGIHALIVLWALSAFFVTMFQCNVPAPWDIINGTCINRTIFTTYFGITNMATDLTILGVMVEATLRIQTSWSKKSLVMGVFGSRVFLIPAIVSNIIYARSAANSDDPIFDTWQTAVITQVIQSISILTACIPILKPFLDSLQTGQLGSDDLRRQNKTSSGYNSGRGAYGYRSNQSGRRRGNISKPLASSDPMTSAISHRSKVHELVELPKARTTGVVTTATHDPAGSWDGQSHTSQKGLIQQTKTWEVDVERRDSSAPSAT